MISDVFKLVEKVAFGVLKPDLGRAKPDNVTECVFAIV
jgi:hypothetical protein